MNLSTVFIDSLLMDSSPKRTDDGYLVAAPYVARTGIQDYMGREVGRPQLGVVKVYRPEEEVFDADAIKSFSHLPVTVDHPSVLVDASNWKQYSVGHTDGGIMRDGEFVRMPMMVMDSKAINDVEGGKVELSMGYTAELDWTAGVTKDGKSYDAVQRRIRGNHLAIVDSARGGSKLRVIDTNPKPEVVMTDKTIVVEGISVQVSDTAAQVFQKAETDFKTKISDAQSKVAALEGQVAKLTTDSKASIDAKDAEIETLKAQLKDSAMTPEKIDAAVKARAVVIDSAKAMLSTVVVDGKSDVEIKRQVVDSKLGEVAKEWSDAQVETSYETLAVSAVPASHLDSFTASVASSTPVVTTDASAAYDQMCKDLEASHLGGAH